MQTQTIFKAGNSEVVAIPKHLLKEMGLGLGHKVVVDKSPVEGVICVRKVEAKKNKQVKTVATKEFNRWLNDVLDEDKEILDELAVR